jgi:predicted nucleic acid-binding protein
MRTYLIDSDILIDFFKKKPDAVTLIKHLISMGNITISVISVSELRSGWTEKEASIYLPKLYDLVKVIPVTKDIAEHAGACRQKYSTRGQKIPTIDSLIASTAILYSYCLVTRNIKHYPMQELELYKEIY